MTLQDAETHGQHASVAPLAESAGTRWPLLGRLGRASLAGFAIVAGLSAWLVLLKIERQYSKDVENVLTTVLRTTHEAMLNLAAEYRADATTWASSAELIDNVKLLLTEPRTPESLLASPAQARLRALLQPASERRRYTGIYVIAPDYVSLASMRDANVGTTHPQLEQGEFLVRVFGGAVLLSRPTQSDGPAPLVSSESTHWQPAMFVAAPVRDETGSVIAALAFRIAPAQDFTRIARLGRIGETGDTYLFDQRGRFFTESRFQGQLRRIGLLAPDEHEFANIEIRDPGGDMVRGFRPGASRSQQPLTRMAADAIRGRPGVDVEGYRDYRGVSVVGAWTWDQALGFGMATEMSRSEAYRAYRNTLYLLLVGPLLTVALVVTLLVVSATGRTRALRLAEQMTVALRESERRYRSLVQTAGNVIVFLSPDRRILEFNVEAERLHGRRREELLGKDYLSLCLPESSRDQFADVMDALPAKRSVGSFECPVLTRDGKEPILLWNLTCLLDDHGQRLGIIAVGHDVTEHRRAEERALLAERLAAIGQVSTGLAHESRNALARSQACLEMLAWRVEDRPEAADLVARIQDAQRHLLRLYEEVREYAAPIKLVREQHDLKEIVSEVWEDLTVEREGRKVRFRSEDTTLDLRSDVDRLAIGQVFRNIFENSLAACPDPVEIEVRWSEGQIDGTPALCTALRNNGPPLSREEKKRIFEAFYTTKTRGTGLGMAISKRIVEAHGGRIAIGEPKTGVEILITLPRSKP